MKFKLMRAVQPLTVVTLLVLVMLVSPPASASLVFTTITFEEPGLPVPATPSTLLPSIIGDMLFGPAGHTDSRFPMRPLSDVSHLYSRINLSISSPNGLNFGPLEGVFMRLYSGGTFNFVSAFFGSTHGGSFSLSGYRNGQVAFSAVAGSPQFTPLLFVGNFLNIDALIIVSGPYNTGYNVTDNLTYSVDVPDPPPPPPQIVPEPTTLALIGMALLSLFGFGMMRRRADA